MSVCSFQTKFHPAFTGFRERSCHAPFPCVSTAACGHASATEFRFIFVVSGSFRHQFEISLYPRLSSPVPVVESTSQTNVTQHNASSRHAPPGGPAAGPSPPGGPAAGPSAPGGPAAGPRPEVGRSPPEPAAFHRRLVGLVRKNDFCVHPRQCPASCNDLSALADALLRAPSCARAS